MLKSIKETLCLGLIVSFILIITFTFLSRSFNYKEKLSFGPLLSYSASRVSPWTRSVEHGWGIPRLAGPAAE